MAELIDPKTETNPAAYRVPTPRTALVGRARELDSLVRRLRDELTPIVTITGPGGVGKTRLALHAAWSLRDDYGGDVVFVPLADVERQDWLVRRIAHALALRSYDAQISEASLIEELRERRILLVLDNLEQIEEAGHLVARIAESGPGVTMLITSRVAMRIRGEVEIPLAPLSLPKSDLFHTPSLDELRQSSAVSLFCERAQAVNPGFALSPENAGDIVRICERLDGLPLALELAAARLKLLTPAALLARLDNRLRVLGGGARDLPDRQQTLRQTIAWSYDLLDPNERTIFRTLSVFANGFSIEAAAVIFGVDTDDPELLDWLGSLVDQSLLQRADGEAGETRLAMLETIREFGLEQLKACDEEEQARSAHAAYYRRFAEATVSAIEKRMSPAVADQLEHELANIHQALDWFIERSDADGTVSLVLVMSKFWLQRGYLVEGSRLMERAVALVDRVAPLTQARMLKFSAWFLCMRGDLDEALAQSSRALAMARAENDPQFLADSLNTYGVIRIYNGEHDLAREAWLEALDLAELHSGRRSGVLNNLGVIARLNGDYDEAERLFNASIEGLPADERAANRGHELANLSELAMLRGDLVSARRMINEWFSAEHRLRDFETVISGAWGAAALAFREGDLPQAALILGWTDDIQRRLGLSDKLREIHDEQLHEEIASALGQETFDQLARKGAVMSIEELVLIATGEGSISIDTGAFIPSAVANARLAPVKTVETNLTARELEVARLVSEGKSNREIAADLFISARTAQTHVTNILAKLELESRAALAAYVVRRHLA